LNIELIEVYINNLVH